MDAFTSIASFAPTQLTFIGYPLFHYLRNGDQPFRFRHFNKYYYLYRDNVGKLLRLVFLEHTVRFDELTRNLTCKVGFQCFSSFLPIT